MRNARRAPRFIGPYGGLSRVQFDSYPHEKICNILGFESIDWNINDLALYALRSPVQGRWRD